MTDEQPIQARRETSTIDRLPIDVFASWCLLGLLFFVGITVPESPLVVIIATPVLFFIPGYVTVAAAFPQRSDAPSLAYASDITIGERAALSVGTSLMILPILGLLAGGIPGGLTPAILGGILGLYVVTVGAVASIRRFQVPPEHRFGIPAPQWSRWLRGNYRDRSAIERLVSIALIGSIILAVAVGGYAIAVPNDGESFTDFYLVTQSGDSYEADEYPTAMTSGDPTTLTTGVENHEGEPTAYVIVVSLDRIVQEDNERQVVESDELARYDATVAPGDTWRETHTIQPSFSGEDLRLTYYLYRGDAPDRAERATAYRTTHLWVDVESAG